MSLYRIRQPTEYSFLQWINSYPDSGHWTDEERFFEFVKTACIYRARKWKDSNYLRQRILDKKPHFDRESLDYHLDLYKILIKFYETEGCPITRRSSREVKKGYYIEVRVKNGEICERELCKD